VAGLARMVSFISHSGKHAKNRWFRTWFYHL